MNQTTNQANPKPKLNFSLWNQLEQKQITREELPTTLFKKLGEPKSELQQNLCQELIKNIVSYYYPTDLTQQNHTVCSVVGYVVKIEQRTRKKGPKKGQVFYDLILGGTREILKAYVEDLPKEKFSQIQKLALLGQNLVFQYRKWFSNKHVFDFYLVPKKGKN